MKLHYWAYSSVIFAVMGLTACQPAEPDPSQMDDVPVVDRAADSVVARVDGTAIYASDVRRAAASQGLIGPEEALSYDSPVFRLTAEELIDQRLLALDAKAQGIADQQEAQRRLLAVRDRILGNFRIETYLAERVNEDTMRALYDAQNSLIGRGEERRVRQIVVPDEATALTVVQRLEDEEDFAQLVAEFSIDEASRGEDGELGWVSRDMLPEATQSVVYRTPEGGRSAPVESEVGWHVIEVLDRRSPAPRSYEETKEDIQRFMTFEAIQSLMADLREAAEVERLYETLASDPSAEREEDSQDETGAP